MSVVVSDDSSAGRESDPGDADVPAVREGELELLAERRRRWPAMNVAGAATG